jgi:hypothetical protein
MTGVAFDRVGLGEDGDAARFGERQRGAKFCDATADDEEIGGKIQ